MVVQFSPLSRVLEVYEVITCFEFVANIELNKPLSIFDKSKQGDTKLDEEF